MLALLLALVAPIAQQSQPVESSIDALLSARGVNDLTEDQRAKISALVLSLLRPRPGDGIAASARAYMAREGYKVCDLALMRVDGKDWLVVEEFMGSSATKDVPILFSSMSFRNGEYFCKRSILHGITEFIDDRGGRQSLLFADWIDLK